MSRERRRMFDSPMEGFDRLDDETLKRLQAIAAREHSEDEEERQSVTLKQDRVDNYYVVGDVLGKGRFGTVYRCQCKDTGKEFAGKFIRKVGLRRVKRDEIQREVDIMNEVHSRRVVSLRDGFETAEFVVLMLDLATGGELFDYLAEKDALTEDEAAKFTRHILEGIDCMHEKNIVHLDLKPENIMLKDKNRSKVIIIDMGLARDLNKGEVKDICGTPEFVAPEVLNFEPITLATDMWTVGVIVYIMLSGCSPFLGDDDNETMANVCNGDYEFYEEYFSEVSTGAKDFIKKLLRFRPQDRSTAYQSLMHPWIKPKRGQRSRSRIDTARLKRFNARQKWQATMEAVKLSLRMRISIGSVSSWINSHPSCSSLSLDSQSSVTEDFESSVDKNVLSSEYSDSVFASPARHPSQQSVGGSMKWSMCGSVSSINDTDDEVTSSYSKSDAMAKVHQLIESRNLKPTSSQSEASPMPGEETEEYSRIGNSLLDSVTKRERKVGTGFSPLLLQSKPSIRLPDKEQSAEAADVDDEDLMSGVVASLRQEVKARHREGEKTKCNNLDNVQFGGNPDNQGNGKKSTGNMKNEAIASAGQTDVSVRPDCDEKTEVNVERSESRVQKLRNTIMKWRKSSTSDGDKMNGKRKGLDVVCAESDDKGKKEIAVASAEEPVQKKKRKKVIRRVVKKVIKKRKVPKHANPQTDLSTDVASVDASKEEKPKVSIAKERGLSRLLRKLSFSRSRSSSVVPKNCSLYKQEEQLDHALIKQTDSSGLVDNKTVEEGMLELNRVCSSVPSHDDNNGTIVKQPRDSLPDLVQDAQEHGTGTHVEVTTVMSIEQPPHLSDSQTQCEDVPQEQTAEKEDLVTVDPINVDPVTVDDVEDGGGQEVVTILPAANSFLENHVCEEKEETACNYLETVTNESQVESNVAVGVKDHDGIEDDITVNSRLPSPDTLPCNEVKVEETPQQQHINHNKAVPRFRRWEQEKKVSVLERVQMYQDQTNVTVENVRKAAHNVTRPIVRSESVTSLREKYESAAARPKSGSLERELSQEKIVKSRTLVRQETAYSEARSDADISKSKSVIEDLSIISNDLAPPKYGVNSVNRSSSMNCLYSNLHSKVSPNSGGLSYQGHQHEYRSARTTPDTTPKCDVVSPKLCHELRISRLKSDSEPETKSQKPRIQCEIISPRATPEPDALSPVSKVRQMWMSREELDQTVDKSKSMDSRPPPKIQLRDSWQKTETKSQPKEVNKLSSFQGSVLLSRVPPVAGQNQGSYKKQARDNKKETAGKVVEVGNNRSSSDVVSNKQPSEPVAIKKLEENGWIDIPSSCEVREVQNGRVGRYQSEESVNSNSSVATTNSSLPVQVGTLEHLPGRYKSSVTVQRSLITPTVSERSAVKVAPRDVNARIVRLHAANESNHKHVTQCGPTGSRSDFRQATRESGGVTVPRITMNKHSLSSGKSGSRINMTFSVQKP